MKFKAIARRISEANWVADILTQKGFIGRQLFIRQIPEHMDWLEKNHMDKKEIYGTMDGFDMLDEWFNLEIPAMNRFTTINNIPMIQLGDQNWKIQQENDGSEVFELLMGGGKGNENEVWLIALYGKGTLSIRQYKDYVYKEGGFTLFMELPLELVPAIIEAIIKGQGLTLMPIYHKDTVIKERV